jgi:hypothetical protein
MVGLRTPIAMPMRTIAALTIVEVVLFADVLV